MASGFLTLSDGRCFAPLTWAYDEVLRAIAGELDDSPPARRLSKWLLEQLPGPEDIEPHAGFWIRASDNSHVDRVLDVRDLTPENRKLFHDATLLAADRVKLSEALKNPISLESHLTCLSDFILRTDRGEPPLDHSMCVVVMPFHDRKVGPGWWRHGAGNPEAARIYFREFTRVAVGDERPELVVACKKIGEQTSGGK